MSGMPTTRIRILPSSRMPVDSRGSSRAGQGVSGPLLAPRNTCCGRSGRPQIGVMEVCDGVTVNGRFYLLSVSRYLGVYLNASK